MNISKQLYQLQELDLETEANEHALSQIAHQIGESQVVAKAQTKFARSQEHLEELKRKQHSAEWEINDLVDKLTTAENKLYSGTVKNPKELTSLQHEVDVLKSRRNQLEDETLETMDQVELATTSVTTLENELKRLKVDWNSQQQQLSADMDQLKTTLSDLKHKRQQLSAKIDPSIVEFYQELKKQKGTGVAKIEQGICCGCRISLSTAELQQARSGTLVKCSSCGRILFLV